MASDVRSHFEIFINSLINSFSSIFLSKVDLSWMYVLVVSDSYILFSDDFISQRNALCKIYFLVAELQRVRCSSTVS